MKRITRRNFIKGAAAVGASLALPYSRVRGANNDIRAAVVGFNGHGRTHINAYNRIPGVRLAALCDADKDVLDAGVRDAKGRNQTVDAYTDIRKLLEDKSIDVVSTATPNHWHSLVTVWACQAGKDVCVEKPVSHNIFEGRKTVDAARRYNRIVQADLDMRSGEALREAIAYIQRGELGKIVLVRGFCYKRRESIGKVSGPQKVPESVDYDLWCGPAPKGPLMRKNLHYDWHWVWATGCGEIGNNGPHQLDACRWALGETGLPRRVMSIGGRFGYDDDGETPNTQIAFFDYPTAPIIYEVRGLPTKTGDNNMDVYRSRSRNGVVIESGKSSPNPNTGVVVQCENGFVDLDSTTAYDNKGEEIKKFTGPDIGPQANFIKAVRSRKIADARTDILQGHLSTCLCHMGNISHRLGRQVGPERIKEAIPSDHDMSEAFGRFDEHLRANGVSIGDNPPILGPWLTMDSDSERFTGEFSDQADKLLTRDYRKPFVVPEKV
ncbi:MAG: Gfo/Idh/MocA family oxidoreductase [Sedimentisphaerales bacterium]|nr:Gfo/Idh/MocA family oxidoreductase [Sedimentisphaerales bacterium]